ncbi:glycosyltransferase [bacterium SCSIO 12741]|nr:glycosyltransferase [bacterium SCSIO 12741]
MKKIALTVTTDLVYDQRMRRICTSLHEAGYEVTLIGRVKKSSPKLRKQPFKQVRLSCFFEKGKLFYIEYNLRLLLYLMIIRMDIICGIDLDTLVPAFMTARLRGKPLVYDAHEYFSEMEEVVNRPSIRKAWKSVERWIVPQVKYAYTVSKGYAELFRKEYGVEFEIVRNATVLRELKTVPKDEPYILYQGAVNYGRGLEPMIEAMHKIDCQLIVCGKGDIYEKLMHRVEEEHLEDKVSFKGYVEPDELVHYTLGATLGLTLFDAKGLSNKYSMANRFYDYMHSGVPQIAMNYPDYKMFNEEFEVATLVDDLQPFTLASAINHLLKDKKRYDRLHENTLEARKHYNWQQEEKRLLGVYESVVRENF